MAQLTSLTGYPTSVLSKRWNMAMILLKRVCADWFTVSSPFLQIELTNLF
jgi:hypothetical protein